MTASSSMAGVARSTIRGGTALAVVTSRLRQNIREKIIVLVLAVRFIRVMTPFHSGRNVY